MWAAFQYSALAYVDSVVKQVEISCFKEMLHTNPKFATEVIEILIPIQNKSMGDSFV
jgi:hypothetical protein